MLTLGPVIGTGTRSTVHALGHDRVVKVPLPGTPDAWIRREAEYSAIVRSLGLPVPHVHDVSDHDGRLVVVYERVHGPSMWAHIAGDPSSAASMGEMLGQLHLAVLGRVGPMPLPRQRDRLTSKIRAAAGHLGFEIETAMALVPDASEPLQLCHGDMHPGNVILSPDGPIVLDWFDASRGIPLADIARSSILMGAGGATDACLQHLVPFDQRAVRTLHDSYLASMREAMPRFVDDDFRRWIRIEAAARLAEGVPPADLIALWGATAA